MPVTQAGVGIGVPAPMVLGNWFFPAAADIIDRYLMRLPFPARIISAHMTMTLAGTGTVALTKCAAGTAPASGTVVVAATTLVQTALASVALVLTATDADRLFAEGDYLALDAATPATLTGFSISVVFFPNPPVRRQYEA